MPNTQQLTAWFDKNQRLLPWRETSDPYKIWLSEIILQQTRVDQGRAYYLKFVDRFPAIEDLAAASEDVVLKLWQGLGYYSRARNLHTASKIVVADFNGVFPSDYRDLIQLPGIGPYTAAAIASIAFSKPFPVLDGNVLRVVSRWFDIHEPIDTAAGKKAVQTILADLMDKDNPGKFNQAMMEFGATFCVPRQPDCQNCIFNNRCMAFHNGNVGLLPVKSKKVTPRNRFFYHLVLIVHQNNEWFTVIRKRDTKDIWQGLYEFPGVEMQEPVEENQIARAIDWKEILSGSRYSIKSISEEFVHLLTHQRIHARFMVVQVERSKIMITGNNQFIPLKSLLDFPVSRLTEKFLQRGFIKEWL
jgi:A/G-specific adenine glycosylase